MGDARFVFEARTIQRMELLVLSTLKWRMQAVTPFSFIDYFLTKINGGDQIASSSSIMKCIELILSTLQGKFVNMHVRSQLVLMFGHKSTLLSAMPYTY